MPTLFIASDFSPAAENATRYGLHLAEDLGAKAVLFNGYHVPVPAAGLGTSISRFDIKAAADDALADGVDSNETGVDIESCSAEGHDAETIIKIANEKNADLILAGMKGKGQTVRKVFGTTALTLARKSNIPVLIIPENAGYKSPSTVVVATDQSQSFIQLERVNFLVEALNIKFYVVTVDTGKHYEAVPQQEISREGVQEKQNVFFKTISGEDVSEALEEFVFTHNGDMLAMQPHRHTFFDNIFQRSETKSMIFTTKLPLLILPEA